MIFIDLDLCFAFKWHDTIFFYYTLWKLQLKRKLKKWKTTATKRWIKTGDNWLCLVCQSFLFAFFLPLSCYCCVPHIYYNAKVGSECTRIPHKSTSRTVLCKRTCLINRIAICVWFYSNLHSEFFAKKNNILLLLFFSSLKIYLAFSLVLCLFAFSQISCKTLILCRIAFTFNFFLFS